MPMWRHIADSDASMIFVAQIEDPVALDEIDAIAATEGVDSLFIGRGDLTAAFGDEIERSAGRAPRGRAHLRGGAQGQQVDQCLCRQRDRSRLAGTLGASVFVLSSDQGFLRQAAAAGLRDVREKVGGGRVLSDCI